VQVKLSRAIHVLLIFRTLNMSYKLIQAQLPSVLSAMKDFQFFKKQNVFHAFKTNIMLHIWSSA